MFEEERVRKSLLPILIGWVVLGTLSAATLTYAPPIYQAYKQTQLTLLEFSQFKQVKANHQKELEVAYTKGFQDGVKSVNVPKTCTAWWFDTNLKDRQKEAQLAYCKGRL